MLHCQVQISSPYFQKNIIFLQIIFWGMSLWKPQEIIGSVIFCITINKDSLHPFISCRLQRKDMKYSDKYEKFSSENWKFQIYLHIKKNVSTSCMLLVDQGNHNLLWKQSRSFHTQLITLKSSMFWICL